MFAPEDLEFPVIAALGILTVICVLLVAIRLRSLTMTAEMTALQAQIAAAQAALPAIQAKITGLQAQIATIQSQLANTDNPADVQAASDSVKALAGQLTTLGS